MELGNIIKFLHFKKYEDFQKAINEKIILESDIVFIQDKQILWTHNKYYGDVSGLIAAINLQAEEIGLIRQTIENLPAEENVQADWNETNDSLDSFIKNKPNLENYKLLQDIVTSPDVSGATTSFIDTISQDATGKITASKKTVDFSDYIKNDDIHRIAKSGSYNDLENKPETLPNPENLIIQKNGVTLITYDGTSTKTANIIDPEIPTSLKNPNSLSFGTKSYDGSSAITLSAADLGLSNALNYCGITTTPLTDGSKTNPIKINSVDHKASSGCVVFFGDKEFIFNGEEWEEFGYPTDLSGYKTKQLEKTDPMASGNSTTFISNITQDTNGVISASKKTVDFSGLAKTSHEHNFTGIEGITTTSNSVEISVASSEHVHSVVAEGTVESSFTGTKTNSEGPSDSINVADQAHIHKAIFSGSIASTFTGNSSATTNVFENIKSGSGNHTHTLLTEGSVNSSFIGNETIIAKSGSTVTNVASSGHTHDVSISGTVLSSFTGTNKSTESSGPNVTYSSGVLKITLGHTHDYKPEGSVSSTFSGGSGNALPTGNDGIISVANKDHTHLYTPTGSVSSTFTGKTVTSGTPSDTIDLSHSHDITPGGSVSSILTDTEINILATTSNSVSVASNNHTHSITAGGSISSTFTGKTVNSGVPSSTKNVVNSEHTHKYTPAGSISSSN